MQEERDRQIGVISATSAYLLWGLIPIYFKLMSSLAPLEIIAHRVFWSVLLLAVLMLFLPKSGALRRVLSQPKTLLLLAASSACIGGNWLVFVWAVNNGLILQTSLGYFINPLLSIALGMVLLRETLRPAQKFAVVLAAFAVLFRVYQFGAVPYVALFLAATFGAYGLLRKHIAVDPITGLLVETSMLLPLALAYHAYLVYYGHSAFFDADIDIKLLVAFSGIATTVPLVLFAAGARRLNLTTMGILQYLSPCISFCVAIFYYHEEFGLTQVWTFSIVWLALLVYTVDMFRGHRAQRSAQLVAQQSLPVAEI